MMPALTKPDRRASCEARCRRLLERSELLDTSDIDWAEAVVARMDAAINQLTGLEDLSPYRRLAALA